MVLLSKVSLVHYPFTTMSSFLIRPRATRSDRVSRASFPALFCHDERDVNDEESLLVLCVVHSRGFQQQEKESKRVC